MPKHCHEETSQFLLVERRPHSPKKRCQEWSFQNWMWSGSCRGVWQAVRYCSDTADAFKSSAMAIETALSLSTFDLRPTAPMSL
jgi:hypothetical protein